MTGQHKNSIIVALAPAAVAVAAAVTLALGFGDRLFFSAREGSEVQSTNAAQDRRIAGLEEDMKQVIRNQERSLVILERLDQRNR